MRWLARPIALLVTIAFAGAALADGLAFKGVDRSDMMPLVESEQRAYIDCRDGTQRTLLAIDVPLSENEQGV